MKMKWHQLVASPPPTTAWLLDGALVAALRQDPEGLAHCAVQELPAGSWEVGPVGLQGVDRTRLVAHLNAVQGRVEGARRPAVVVPTGWVRTHILEFETLPRRQSELNQLLLWRLKKLLPVLPSELRVSAVPLRPLDGRRRLLCLVGLERTVAELEASFAAIGVEPGSITPRLFALSSGRHPGNWLLVQQEAGFLSLVLTVDDDLRLLRTKPVVVGDGIGPPLLRELGLAERFIRSELKIEGAISVRVSAEGERAREELERWWAERDGVTLAAGQPPRQFAQPANAQRLGDARLEPLLALVAGVAE